ncbi:MAG: SIS domain-containing protein [Pleomorphochaeta sp.]
MSITLREINLQYEALIKTYKYLESKKQEIKNFYSQYQDLAINFVGCGSSFNLCQSGEFLIQSKLQKRSLALAGGDLMLNIDNYKTIIEKSLTIIPSRSGSTSEILFAAKKIKDLNSNLPIISIVCKEDSEISQYSDLTLEIPWAFDESVCQTRSVTNLYTVILMLIAYFSNDSEKLNQIKTTIDNGNDFLDQLTPQLKDVATLDWDNVVVLADGELQGLATEGSLAFAEISRTKSSYYHLLDVRHGPVVLINEKTLVILCIADYNQKYINDLIKDLINRKANIVIYSQENIDIDDSNEKIIQINSKNKVSNDVLGISFINIPQLLSYYKAKNQNINPDQPEGLDAWIKLG